MSHFTRIISASFVVALAACGGGTGPYGSKTQSPPPPPPPPPGNTVSATAALAFTPNSLTVNSGETVTFAFGAVAHNVTFDTPDATTPTDIPGNNSNVSVDR
ncbi:MAG TPA: plastocyanin/azurin family copper-binding protein, partial [Gemmatimonadaceae bacterium]|nr:plastocyanin/azurin family copper-binding protein [Gemmatimonadaceae bacterium]